MVGSQPDDEPVLLDFYRWVRTARCCGSSDAGLECDRSFVPYPKLQEYFQEPHRIRNLLQALFPELSEPPVGPERIQRSYCRIFSILLLICKGRYIRHFVQYGNLTDQHLPFHPNSPPAFFPWASPGHDFFASFCNTQWEFCAPKLEYDMIKRFEDDEILPIISKKLLAEGGSAVTYKVQLHPAYNELNPNSRLDPVITDVLPS